MSGKVKSIVFSIVLISMTLLTWGLCIADAQKIQYFDSLVELRYDITPISRGEVEKLESGERESTNKLINSFVAWREDKNQRFKNKETGKNIEGNIITYYGDLSLLIRPDQLTGEILQHKDKEGAIISEAVALNLWGSKNVLGQQLMIGDRGYIVKGIVKEKQNMVFFYGQEEKLDFIALRLHMVSNDYIDEHIQILGFRYNLPKSINHNMSLASTMLSQLVYLPGCLLGIYILFKLYKFIYKTYHYWVSALLLGGIAILITWVMWDIIKVSINIPSYMIPNQWSDFDFLSRKGKELIENSEKVRALAMYLPNIWYVQVKNSLLTSFSLSMIGTLAFITCIRVKTGTSLFVLSIISVLFSFGTIVIFYTFGITVIGLKAFWVIIPLYMSISLLIHKWNKLIKEEPTQM